MRRSLSLVALLPLFFLLLLGLLIQAERLTFSTRQVEEEQRVLREEHLLHVVTPVFYTENSTRYTAFAALNKTSNGYASSFDFLRDYALPCHVNETSSDWTKTLTVDLLFPCEKRSENCGQLAETRSSRRLFSQFSLDDFQLDEESSRVLVETRRVDERLQGTTNVSVALLRFSFDAEGDRCAVHCDNGDLVVRHAACEDRRSARKRLLECDFEGASCLWSFTSPSLAEPKKLEDNFKIVASERNGKSTHAAYFNVSTDRKEPAMIVSPFYQHTSLQCEVRFLYRIYGGAGSSLIVTTEHRRSEDEDEEEEWSTPTQHALFLGHHSFADGWNEGVANIGHISEPTRIRLECHRGPTSIEKGAPSEKTSVKELGTECFVDDIQLLRCDAEKWHEDVCESNATRKFLCHRRGYRKCVDVDALCDFSIDCPGAEDEDLSLHNCSALPTGARCDFENDKGCPGWSIETFGRENKVLESHLLERWTTRSLLGTMPADHRGVPTADHTNSSVDGAFLFYSSDMKKSKLIVPTFTYFTSPAFPPVNPVLFHPDAPEMGECRVRFFYCLYGRALATIQLHALPLNGKEPVELWSPKHEGTEPAFFCHWKRESVVLPIMKSEYKLRLSVTQLFESSISFGFDDFSMSPSCFAKKEAWESQLLPMTYNLSTCGQTGHIGPSPMDCHHAYNGSQNVQPESTDVHRGAQHFFAPKTGEYRLIVNGGAGGKLPRVSTKNGGGRVVVHLILPAGSDVEVIVGQKGEQPCGYRRHRTNNADLEHAYDFTCNRRGDRVENLSKGARDLLPGSSGGGATVVRVDGNLIVVAGAGGGVFVEGDGSRSIGGRKQADAKEASRKKRRPRRSTRDDVGAGIGASVFANLVNSFFNQRTSQSHHIDCLDCEEMSGLLSSKTSAGGSCPPGSLWSVPGGFGGGGASCGASGGGGAGYQGGRVQTRQHGEGGSSWSLYPALFDEGVNEDDGGLLIFPCRKTCPTDAMCRFLDFTSLAQHCVCSNGDSVEEDEECPVEVASLKPPWYYISATLAMLAFCLFLLLVFIAFCLYFRRRLAKSKKEKAQANSQEMQTLTRTVVEGNPIYAAALCAELEGFCGQIKTLVRTSIVLKGQIGQGAFGEVFEAELLENGKVRKVAVKTLPFSSSKQAQEDFLMEALIMNRFRHKNIVGFYGVNFEGMPRYLVIELMEGGDLKSFLRCARPNKMDPNPMSVDMLDLTNMCLDVARGCAFMESNKFIHRDIAARNCLISSRGKGDRVVKIADFGMARDIYKMDYYRKGGKAMLPVKWMPPEAFLDGLFTAKTDVWSYGVLAWEVFSLGYMPYPGRNNMEVMQLVTTGGRLEPPAGVPAIDPAVIQGSLPLPGGGSGSIRTMPESPVDHTVTTNLDTPSSSSGSIAGFPAPESGASRFEARFPEGLGIRRGAASPYIPRSNYALSFAESSLDSPSSSSLFADWPNTPKSRRPLVLPPLQPPPLPPRPMSVPEESATSPVRPDSLDMIPAVRPVLDEKFWAQLAMHYPDPADADTTENERLLPMRETC